MRQLGVKVEIGFAYPVRPVYNDHSWDLPKVFVVQKVVVIQMLAQNTTYVNFVIV
jgi:hypothetical protein